VQDTDKFFKEFNRVHRADLAAKAEIAAKKAKKKKGK
jgi:hypothetical protein